MKAHIQESRRDAHAFCPVCGKPFSETEKVVAEHTNNFQCHHCWNPVPRVEAHSDPHFRSARKPGRVIPLPGKHRR
jgi:predicted amidophosphoribosyltransferase